MINRKLNPLDILNKNKSILLLGPRGTGKTEIIKTCLKDTSFKLSIDLLRGDLYRRYLDDPTLLESEVKQLISKSELMLIVSVDEIQKIPSLLDEVHRVIELYKNRVVFLLTGSSARKLKRGGANLLGGRAVSKNLHPFHQCEVELPLLKTIQFGSLPSVYFEDKDIAISTLDTYVSMYLREEIQQESLVRGIDRFSRFLELAAQLNSEPINFSKLGRQLKIASKTVQEYFSILKDTLIVRELPGWSESVKKQLIHASKFYFFDTGVLNAINGYLRVDQRQGGFLFGKLFETFIVNQLLDINDYQDLGLRFYYWKDRHNHEVDLIIARNSLEPLLAVEIKASTNPSLSDCQGFLHFEEDYPNVKKICICRTPHEYSEKSLVFMPWEKAVIDLKGLL